MSQTPRTDALELDRLAMELWHDSPMNAGDYADLYERAIALGRQLESENAELRAALKDCVEYAERYEDSGPIGEGWQSDRLVAACNRARALLARLEADK